MSRQKIYEDLLQMQTNLEELHESDHGLSVMNETYLTRIIQLLESFCSSLDGTAEERDDIENPLVPVRLDLPYKEARMRAVHEFQSAYCSSLLAIHSTDAAKAAQAAGMDKPNFYRIMRTASRKLGKEMP